MTSKDWSIEALFHEALEKPESDRRALLDRACGDNPKLREQVEALIRRASNDASFERNVLQAASDAPPADSGKLRNLWLGRQVGAYKILSLVGVGGMGEVYRARDTKLKRDVAMKVLPSELAKDRELDSFFQAA